MPGRRLADCDPRAAGALPKSRSINAPTSVGDFDASRCALPTLVVLQIPLADAEQLPARAEGSQLAIADQAAHEAGRALPALSHLGRGVERRMLDQALPSLTGTD